MLLRAGNKELDADGVLGRRSREAWRWSRMPGPRSPPAILSRARGRPLHLAIDLNLARDCFSLYTSNGTLGGS